MARKSLFRIGFRGFVYLFFVCLWMVLIPLGLFGSFGEIWRVVIRLWSKFLAMSVGFDFAFSLVMHYKQKKQNISTIDTVASSSVLNEDDSSQMCITQKEETVSPIKIIITWIRDLPFHDLIEDVFYKIEIFVLDCIISVQDRIIAIKNEVLLGLLNNEQELLIGRADSLIENREFLERNKDSYKDNVSWEEAVSALEDEAAIYQKELHTVQKELHTLQTEQEELREKHVKIGHPDNEPFWRFISFGLKTILILVRATRIALLTMHMAGIVLFFIVIIVLQFMLAFFWLYICIHLIGL